MKKLKMLLTRKQNMIVLWRKDYDLHHIMTIIGISCRKAFMNPPKMNNFAFLQIEF